ncbi:carbohydrate-binding protein [Fulvivirga ligni]|uniref:carbohydrate-binding protein n=1 Tax=Fulvivirga ligni TaxID=2904246 RepID=UPI001F2841B0|nr:carbohydrate-binding protein [Fulvivirga ligni]UII19973.1 carbohydrate-binding protein [Fulvivirga ligni]
MRHISQMLCFCLVCGLFSVTYGQDGLRLGSVSTFKDQLKSKVDRSKTLNQRTSGTTIDAQLPDNSTLQLQVSYENVSKEDLTLVGKVGNIEKSSFFIKVNNGVVKGNIVIDGQKNAFEYTSKGGEVFIEEKRADRVVCIEYPNGPANAVPTNVEVQDFEIGEAANNLQSLPGANACILLDFDGYNLPAGTGWLNGNSWTAPASGMSDAAITEAWELVAEDFRPYNVNVTTSQSVYNSYAQNRRQRCVFTPANDPAPGAGGVAYVGAFGYNEWPCWVFIMSGKAGGDAASHEVGHTLGLGHDGRTNPNEGYFLGHGDWAPIMGAGYYKPIAQWSQGEYAYANNTENDTQKMTDYISFRGDDYGNNTGSAAALSVNGSGVVAQKAGVIERRGDYDMFSFNCGTGNISLDVNTVSRHANLDILVNLYEGSGNLIGTFNPSGLNTHIDAYLNAGKYYIRVDGTGAGNPATNGYSDYGSLGSYWITGNVTPGGNNNAVATVYQHCNYGGYSAGLGVGSYNLGDLQALGVINDDVSSIQIQAGYQATFYWDANFTGSTLVKSGNDACLVDDGWNDQITSIVISAAASSNTIQAESYSSMSGVQVEACSEGGENVGYIEAGDWMAYDNITFPNSGTYLIEYRVASQPGGGQLSADLNAGANVLGTLNIPNTGGWQNWSTISHSVSVNAGTYPFGIYAAAGGWNINWIKITYQGAGAPAAQARTGNFEMSTAMDSNTEMVLYPNPSENELHIRFQGEQIKGSILNTMGQIIQKYTLKDASETIDISGLKAGTYLLSIESNDNKVMKRFIKK